MRRRTRKSEAAGALAGVLFPACAVLAALSFASALNNLNQGQAGEARRQLEQAVRRGCVACYAAEGRYPGSLSELEERYGLQIDRERFTVRYRGVAENLMPEITVLENGT